MENNKDELVNSLNKVLGITNIHGRLCEVKSDGRIICNGIIYDDRQHFDRCHEDLLKDFVKDIRH